MRLILLPALTEKHYIEFCSLPDEMSASAKIICKGYNIIYIIRKIRVFSFERRLDMTRKYIVWYLVAAMFVIGIAPRLDAAFVPSQGMVVTSSDRESDLQAVQGALENKLVQQRLKDLGYTSGEIKERLAQLTDQQLHSIAQKLDDLRVGQDSALGIVIAVLVIILLIILIINLTSGHKVVLTR